MRFGIRLRRLWHLRPAVAACAVFSLLMAVWSVEKVGFSPLSLTPRGQPTAAATLSVAIDTPKSSLIDLREDTHDLDKLTSRAILLGTIMATPPVQQAIARRAGMPAGDLQINAPLVPFAGKEPAPLGVAASITLRASATVPLLDIYALARDTRTAERLADASAAELEAHLARVAAAEDAPEAAQLRLVSLGRAEGRLTHTGFDWQSPLLVFFLTFGCGCATLIFLTRVRDDLRVQERLPEPG